MTERPAQVGGNAVKRDLQGLFNAGGLVRRHGDGLEQLEPVLMIGQFPAVWAAASSAWRRAMLGLRFFFQTRDFGGWVVLRFGHNQNNGDARRL